MLLLQFISKLLKPQSWKFGFGTIAPRYKLCVSWSCIELNYRNQINSLYRGATSYTQIRTHWLPLVLETGSSLSVLVSHYQIMSQWFHPSFILCALQIPVLGSRDLSKCWSLWSHLQGCGYLRSEYCISGFGLAVWIIWLKYHTTVQYQ